MVGGWKALNSLSHPIPELCGADQLPEASRNDQSCDRPLVTRLWRGLVIGGTVLATSVGQR